MNKYEPKDDFIPSAVASPTSDDCDSGSDGRVFALFLNFTSLIFLPSKLSVTECLDVQRFVCGSISGT